MALYEVKSFSGGITDQTEDAPSNYAAALNNLWVTPDDKIYSRYGSRLFYSASARPSSISNPGTRCDSLISFNREDSLFGLFPTATEVNLWRTTGSAWAQITGSAVNGCLDGDSTCQTSHGQWQGHLFITNDASFNGTGTTYPAKIYKDSGGTYRLRTAGLPAFPNPENQDSAAELAAYIAMANEMRTDFANHYASVFPGAHVSADTAAAALITASAATDLASLLLLTGQLLRSYRRHHIDASYGTPTYHFYSYGALGYYFEFNPDSTGTPTTLQEAAERLSSLKVASNHHIFQSVSSNWHAVQTSLITSADYSHTQGPTLTTGAATLYRRYLNLANAYMGHIYDNAQHSTHGADLRLAFSVMSVDNTLPTSRDDLIGKLITFINSYAKHTEDAASTSSHAGSHAPWHNGTQTSSHQLSLVGSDPAFPYTNYMNSYISAPEVLKDTATFEECARKIDKLSVAFNAHNSDASAHAAVSPLPYVSTGISPTFGAYVYSFVYAYTYTVGSLTYVDRSSVLTKRIDDACDPSVDPLVITTIPVLANSGLTNYDASNVVIEIYRTLINGTISYLVGSVTNGTTTFSDTLSDEDILENEVLYTAGGVVENDPPPQSKFIHVVGDVALYGYVIDGTDTIPSRIVQSIPGDLDSVPGDFFVDIDDTLMGLSSVNSKKLAFGARNTYRIDGQYDLRGQGGMTYEKISDVTGAINSVGIVQTEEAVFFLGLDGVYMTDGYQVRKLSEHLNSTYAALTNSDAKKRRMVGVYDKTLKLIHWGVQSLAASSDNDAWLTLDLKKPLGSKSCFMTASNGGSFAPTALTYFGSQVIRGDSRGFVFKHDAAYLSDPKVVDGSTPSAWAMKAIIFNYLSPNSGFGMIDRKWATDIEVSAKNATQLSLQINSINDGGRKQYALKPIHFRGNLTWEATDILWGDGSARFDEQGYIRERRRFKTGHLRFDYKQIQFTNAYTTVVNSDTLGLGGVDSSAKTLTVSGVGIWPSDPVDYYLSFADDNYTIQYLVTARTSNTVLTFSDSANNSSNGTKKWLLKGYPKDESLYLLSYAIPFDSVTKPGSDLASNAQGGNS